MQRIVSVSSVVQSLKTQSPQRAQKATEKAWLAQMFGETNRVGQRRESA